MVQSRRPCVLYNRRALQVAAKLDEGCPQRLSDVSTASREGRLRPNESAEPHLLDHNREVLLRTLALNGNQGQNARGDSMRHAAPELRQNRGFMTSAVRVNGLALEHAPPELRADRELVMAAVRQNGLALEYAAYELKGDVEVCCTAVAQTPSAIMHVASELRNCYEVRLAGDRSSTMHDDRHFMMQALTEEPHLLQYASKRLQHDAVVVLAAVGVDGLALEFASKTLRANSSIVRRAVEQNGLALEFAGDTQKSDIDIVTLAIAQNAMSLQFASEELKDDKRVVLRALQFNGLALQFASERMKRDKGVVFRALRENHKSWAFASEALRNDPEFSSKRLQKILAIDFGIHVPSPDDVDVSQKRPSLMSWGSFSPQRERSNSSAGKGGLPPLLHKVRSHGSVRSQGSLTNIPGTAARKRASMASLAAAWADQ